jgi:hypothetical protein
MRVARKDPIQIEAFQFKADGSELWPDCVYTYDGVPYVNDEPVEDGDWIVIGIPGSPLLYSDELFQEEFTILE